MTHRLLTAARRPAPLYALAMLVFCGFFASTAARAEEAPNVDLGKPFAQVWRLQGDVFATGKLGTPRRLREGATVHVGEQVKASSNGEAVLKTSDAGIVAVRPNAEFVAERYAAEGKASDRQVLRLITGSLRVITGANARFGLATVSTPTMAPCWRSGAATYITELLSSSGSSSAYAFKPGGSLKLKGDDGKKDKKKMKSDEDGSKEKGKTEQGK